MNMSTLDLISILSGTGSVFIFVYATLSFFVRLISSASSKSVDASTQAGECNVKNRQRSYPKYQHLIKFSWPLIILLGRFVLPFMTWGLRQRITLAIAQAGIVGLSCEQFVAFQLMFTFVVCSVLCVIFSMVFQYSIGIVLLLSGCIASVSFIFPRLWLRSIKTNRYAEIEKGLPFFLDLVALGLEAGMNLQTSVQLALDHLHAGPLKDEWTQTMFDIRSGVVRADAFRHLSQRVDLMCIRQMVVAFIQGESMGLSLVKSISEFSRQQGQYRLLRLEKQALQAPVKMLFPLGFCIFPCTFLVLGFPVVAQLLGLEL
jgi:tight adherence protein C